MIPMISQSGFLSAGDCTILSGFLEGNVKRPGRENVSSFFSYRRIDYARVDGWRVQGSDEGVVSARALAPGGRRRTRRGGTD